MPLAVPILQTTLADRRPDRQGKVRDIYEFGDRLLIVATDRISAFDYVLGSGIPDKGKVLTQISTFWFERMQPIVANHLLSTTRLPIRVKRGERPICREVDARHPHRAAAGGMRRPGTCQLGWKDNARPVSCAASAAQGLRESDRLAEPIFRRRRRRRRAGVSITEKDAAELVGRRVLDRVKELTLRLYAEGAHAESCGIIVADTKFEFGLCRSPTATAVPSRIA